MNKTPKYVAYFEPEKELSDLILKQNDVSLPGSGLHASICFFYMGPKHENKLISDLSKISFQSFQVRTTEFEDFDKDSLVLKLTKPDELQNLHEKIVTFAERYADESFQEIKEKYFGKNYNPHITIAKSSSNFGRNSNELIGHKNTIRKYSLLKRVGDGFENLSDFYALKDNNS